MEKERGSSDEGSRKRGKNKVYFVILQEIFVAIHFFVFNVSIISETISLDDSLGIIAEAYRMNNLNRSNADLYSATQFRESEGSPRRIR